MPRDPKTKKNIADIKIFSRRKDFAKWLPSATGNPKDFEDTFTLKGKNLNTVTGVSTNADSKGEINILTKFNQGDDINLYRFYLALFCLGVTDGPYINRDLISEVQSYNKDNVLFSKKYQNFLFDFQTGKGSNAKISSGLTADCVRYYRNDKIKNGIDLDPIKNPNLYTELVAWGQGNAGYKGDVAGVLGRVTYDSIIKNTLYKSLLDNKLIPNVEQQGSWSAKALTVNKDPISYVDISGGPYARAFPVFCVLFKDVAGKTINDFIDQSNNIIGKTFHRSMKGTAQLVSTYKNFDKNFIFMPVGETGESVYCVLYDLIEVLLLDPVPEDTDTIDLLKIGLSFLSRRTIEYNNKQKLLEDVQKIKTYLLATFPNLENQYTIKLKNKHGEECDYIGPDSLASLAPKISVKFQADIKNLCITLENVYTNIIKNLSNEQSFILHFDNFYNLLAITTSLEKTTNVETKYPEEIPFDLKEYEIKSLESDLIVKFFDKSETLTSYANGEYSFDSTKVINKKIELITYTFLKQLYEILDQTGKGLVYETDKNNDKDTVLKLESIKLLELILDRTGKTIVKDNVFQSQNNVISLKTPPSEIRIFNLSEVNFSFNSVQIPKINLQTLSHLFFISLTSDKGKDNLFETLIYYPILEKSLDKITEKTLCPDGTPAPDGDISKCPKKKIEKCPDGSDPPCLPPIKEIIKPKNRDFLINNIISAELSCYEDIANSFDKVINGGDELHSKTYYLWQTIYNIGMPTLLAVASQIIASQISELMKNGDEIDPALAECVRQKTNNVKKNIINFSDLLTNLDTPEELIGILIQFVPDIPKIPNIPYLLTFDAEKELKRKVIEWLINNLLKILSGQLLAIIRSFVDICNSDSYLTAFLGAALNSSGNISEKKLGTPTPSGLPAGGMIPCYIPNSLLNINNLISETGTDTKENVYSYFRIVFFLDASFTNEKISDFFDSLSAKIDSGEMAMLLKGSSTAQTRGIVLSFIKRYKDGIFYKVFSDEKAIILLFTFLSNYIDYRLCYQKISDSLLNFTPTVCFDVNSKFNDNLKYFSEENINDQIADLTKTLDDICKTNLPAELELLNYGPSIMSSDLKNTIVNSLVATTKPQDVSYNYDTYSKKLKEIYGENKILKSIVINKVKVYNWEKFLYDPPLTDTEKQKVISIVDKFNYTQEFLDWSFEYEKDINYDNRIYSAVVAVSKDNNIFNPIDVESDTSDQIEAEAKIKLSNYLGAWFEEQVNKYKTNFIINYNKIDIENSIDTLGNAALKTELGSLNGYKTKFDIMLSKNIDIYIPKK